MNQDIRKVLDVYIKRFITHFHPYKIILFGSHAAGSSHPDSDVDLLIIMDVKDTTRNTANKIDALLSDRLIPMDFIVITPEQFKKQKNVESSIICTAATEGKILYECAA